MWVFQNKIVFTFGFRYNLDKKWKDYEYHLLGGCFMQKYECIVCAYVYDPAEGDPDSGVAPGTAFEDLPDDWVCPLCGVGKDQFEAID